MYTSYFGRKLLILGAIFATSGITRAASINLVFSGPGVNANIALTYGSATDSTYPQAFEITGITGTFTDVNNGLNIINTPITGLVAVTHDTPEPGNTLAPTDFSRFAVATGLDPQSNGFLTYSNLYYPTGSPQTAFDYPAAGGLFDIYGLMFTISGSRVVDLWSNGNFSGGGLIPIDYGIAVATSNTALDYLGGVQITPEPSAAFLVGSGLLGLLAFRRRAVSR